MNDYLGISTISTSMISLLQSELVPELVSDRESIQLVHPAERGDARITVYLYDVSEDTKTAAGTAPVIGERRRNPSLYLRLSYLVAVFSEAAAKYRLVEEMKILSAIATVFHDHTMLSEETYQFVQEQDQASMRLEMARLEGDGKMRVQSGLEIPMKPCLFYTIGPVEIHSKRWKPAPPTKEFKRVYRYGKE
ncbi:MAG: DUF4255 domain-containing protein [Lachnospiraceae bacterium]|nr:DUF4255 domain-containing protein [Lachnospiraceae bacterium]